MARNNELIRVAKIAADAWRNTDAYHQAAQIIDMLVEELESDTLTQPNEPLTLEQLREMDGKPVWVEDVDHWVLIDIEKGGEWDGVPFAMWTENGVSFCYNVINRNLICYRRPLEGEEET